MNVFILMLLVVEYSFMDDSAWINEISLPYLNAYQTIRMQHNFNLFAVGPGIVVKVLCISATSNSE